MDQMYLVDRQPEAKAYLKYLGNDQKLKEEKTRRRKANEKHERPRYCIK
jgi:hypothetical protein